MGNEPISLNCSDQLKIKKKCILKIERFGKTLEKQYQSINSCPKLRRAFKENKCSPL